MMIDHTGESAPAAPATETPSESDFFTRLEFVLFAETDPRRAAANQRFLTSPQPLAQTALLRDKVLEHWRRESDPLDPADLFRFALQIAETPGAALQICCNVARVFCDGGSAVPWTKLNRSKGLYTTRLEYFPLKRPSTFAEPSILPEVFGGGVAPVDWPRYFGAAWLAHARAPDPATTADQLNGSWRGTFRNALSPLLDQWDSSANASWFWTNATYFYETAAWGSLRRRTLECHSAAFQGALFGRSLNNADPAALPWHVSQPGKPKILETWTSG
jgi:hypothetical protein